MNTKHRTRVVWRLLAVTGWLLLATPQAYAKDGEATPSAPSWAELSAAELLAYKAAALYDAGQECGAEANAAKYLGTEAGFTACETAVLTHGGMGYAKEYHVERMMREAMLARIAPVSREMILNFVGMHSLGLPKSY